MNSNEFKKFVEKIANIPLLPTTQEFWDLVKQAREILEENE